ncbi:uncharacterized protein LOC126265656 isoform X1 [Aethina tumida]|uniref:uncharacterized protein LOC126265656 isoform X1 n=1 Tax=Aethina tumida TaxID=116153 RepID=UPI00214787CA|nr:uncharacterized protein LOC126265656 isoform X1 [Aethina tumida]
MLFKSRKRVEAEKLLLIENIKKTLLVQASNSTDVQDGHPADFNIRNIRFTLQKAALDNAAYYYVCVLKYGVNVVASDVVMPVKNVIFFGSNMYLKKVIHKLTLSLYHIRIYKDTTHKSKLSKIKGKMLKSLFHVTNGRARHNLDQNKYCKFEQIGETSLPSVNENLMLINMTIETIDIHEMFTADIKVMPHFKL